MLLIGDRDIGPPTPVLTSPEPYLRPVTSKNMLETYEKGKFDIAGFSVGVVERKNLLSKKKVDNGNVILGLESNGFHSNGYSLIRKILNENKINLNVKTPYKSGKKKLGDDLWLPTRIYTKIILPLISLESPPSAGFIHKGCAAWLYKFGCLNNVP